MGSPAMAHQDEQLNYQLVLASFDTAKHLRGREQQYVDVKIMTPGGIMVIRETDEGWWKESYDVSKNPEKQLEKLKNDPTVACGWITTARFAGNGGWELD